jgi:dihydroorotase
LTIRHVYLCNQYRIMADTLFINGRIVNRGIIYEADLVVSEGRIKKIAEGISPKENTIIVDLKGNYLLPGAIDDQVHFREPGLTHKACIASESRAAVAGGITTFMEMPNTSPPAATQALLQDKYDIAARVSPANYSFFMGATNDNLEEVLKTNPKEVCGVKVFMGSSTGNMLVDNQAVLNELFAKCPMLIATHCEDEATIRSNIALWTERFGKDIPMSEHPLIRSREACYLSSSMAIEMAKRHGTRLHILHISTAEETHLFDNELPLKEKRITSEACVHHLHFSALDYPKLGSLIKCNPAIKDPEDRDEIWTALLTDRIDIIATDHAPHTLAEKAGTYLEAPSGLPLVQHSLPMMLEAVDNGRFSLEKMVEKMCHSPADCFRIKDRGYLDEGAWADLVVVEKNAPWTVEKSGLLYQCGWSPLEGHTFQNRVLQTWVNGKLVYDNGKIVAESTGMRIEFEVSN